MSSVEAIIRLPFEPPEWNPALSLRIGPADLRTSNDEGPCICVDFRGPDGLEMVLDIHAAYGGRLLWHGEEEYAEPAQGPPLPDLIKQLREDWDPACQPAVASTPTSYPTLNEVPKGKYYDWSEPRKKPYIRQRSQTGLSSAHVVLMLILFVTAFATALLSAG